MPLEKQVVTIDFGFGGLDKKTTDKRVIPTRLTRAENIEYRNTGSIVKRLGFTRNDETAWTTNTFSTFSDLIIVDNSIIGIFSDNTSLSRRIHYAPTGTLNNFISSSLVQIAPAPRVEYFTFGSGLQFGNVTSPSFINYVSSVKMSTFSLVAIKSGITTSLSVYDHTSGAVVKNRATAVGVSLSSSSVAMDYYASTLSGVYQETPIICYWANTSGVSTSIVINNCDTAATFLQTRTVVSFVWTLPRFAMKTGNSDGTWNTYVASYSGSTSSIVVSKVPITAAAQSSTSLNVGFTVNHVSMDFSTISKQLILAASGASTGTRIAVLSDTLSTVAEFTASSLISLSGVSAQINAISWHPTITNEAVVLISDTYATGGVDATRAYGIALILTSALTVSSATPDAINCALASGSVWTSKLPGPVYLGNFSNSSIQRTAIIGQVSYPSSSSSTASDIAGIILHEKMLPYPLDVGIRNQLNLSSDSNGNVYIPAGKINDIFSLGGTNSFNCEAGYIQLNTDQSGYIYDSKMLGSGVMGSFDDLFLVKAPVPKFYANTINATGVFDASGAKTLTGSYSVTAHYLYTSKQGVASGPVAIPKTVVLAGTQNAISVTISNALPANPPARAGLVVVCTEASGSVYYSERYVDLGTANVNDAFNVVLTLSDTAVVGGSPLYTTGGVLENWHPSSVRCFAVNGRRMVVVENDNKNFVMVSKDKKPNEPYCMLQDIGKFITNGGDSIDAIVNFKNRWCAFKERSIWSAEGDGPDDTGQNDTMSEFFNISSEIGCINKKACVVTSYGIIFISKKGFYFLDDSLSLSYVGAAVEGMYTPEQIVSGTNVQDSGNVYFLTSDGSVLLFSRFESESDINFRWSKHSIATTVSSFVSDGSILYGSLSTALEATSITRSTLTVKQRLVTDSTPYLDVESVTLGGFSTVGTSYSYLVETAWIPMGSLQGYGRMYEAIITGKSNDTNWNASVELAYDYETTYSSAYTISGVLATTGSTTAQWRIKPERQRAEAVRFRITVEDPTSAGTKGLELEQVQMVIGVKGTANKMSSQKQGTK